MEHGSRACHSVIGVTVSQRSRDQDAPLTARKVVCSVRPTYVRVQASRYAPGLLPVSDNFYPTSAPRSYGSVWLRLVLRYHRTNRLYANPAREHLVTFDARRLRVG